MSQPRMGSQRVSLWPPSIFRPLTRILPLFPRKCGFFRTSPLFPRCFQLSPSIPPTFPRFVQGFSYSSNGFPIFPRVFLFFQGFSYFRKTLGKLGKPLEKRGKPWGNLGKVVQNLGGSRKRPPKNGETLGKVEFPWKQLKIPGQGSENAGGP